MAQPHHQTFDDIHYYHILKGWGYSAHYHDHPFQFEIQFQDKKGIDEVLSEATLMRPENAHMTAGGREGIHTEHLGHLLSDMQYLQRAYPDAKW